MQRIYNTMQTISITNPINRQPRLFTLQSLPSHFRCMSGVDFTYHHHLYQSVNNRIATLLPLLQLLVSSFYLKCIFLFYRHDLSQSCPFDPAMKMIQGTIPS